MADPAARYTDEFERKTAGYVISTGRPISGCRREVGLDSKTVNRWAIKRGRGFPASPTRRSRTAIGHQGTARAMESFFGRTRPAEGGLPMAA